MSYERDEAMRMQEATEVMIRLRRSGPREKPRYNQKIAERSQIISRCIHELDPGEGCKLCGFKSLLTKEINAAVTNGER